MPMPGEANSRKLEHVSGQLLVVSAARVLAEAADCWLHTILLLLLLLSVPISQHQSASCEDIKQHMECRWSLLQGTSTADLQSWTGMLLKTLL